jgi:cytochrome c5
MRQCFNSFCTAQGIVAALPLLLLTLLAGAGSAGAAAAVVTDRVEHGRKVYDSHCAVCHETGADGAPSTHRPSDWVDRARVWDALVR